MWPFADKQDAAAEADAAALAQQDEPPPSEAAQELQAEVAGWYKAKRERAEQDTSQRRILFVVAVCLGCASVAASIAGFALIGFGVMTIDAPIAIAFFSASAVQGFAMLGLIVRGLFLTGETGMSKSKSSEDEAK